MLRQFQLPFHIELNDVKPPPPPPKTVLRHGCVVCVSSFNKIRELTRESHYRQRVQVREQVQLIHTRSRSRALRQVYVFK